MPGGSELKSAGARALRAAGYLPLPRLWVTKEQMDLIVWMANQNAEEVNRIRGEVQKQNNDEANRLRLGEAREAMSGLTREEQIERAWKRQKGE